MNAQEKPRAHILAIDDNPDQLRILVEMLRQNGYRISVAFDGAQGYARAQASLPDLILLDVRMPKMNGFAVARLLKADPKTEHIPILILSSGTELEDRLDGLRCGAVDYITKPYLAEEVTERVRIHLELARRWAPVQDQGQLDPLGGNQPCPNAYSPPGSPGKGLAGAIDAMMPEGEAAIYAMQNPQTGSAQEAIALERDRVLLRAATQIIHESLAEPLRSNELAKRLGVSERRLMRAFEKRLGMSLADFIRQRRMLRAEYLLLHSPLSMVAIADEVGFSSPANFSTAFREYSGKSPSVFRKTAMRDDGSG